MSVPTARPAIRQNKPRHTSQWGFTNVQPPPLHTHPTTYQIKPTAPTPLDALPALAFQQRFPAHNFFRVLERFGAGQALGALFEGLPEVRGRFWMG